MIFIDTGAWVAMFSRRDQFHARAAMIWARLRAANAAIVTSDSIFAETMTLLARNLHARAAAEAGRFLQRWGHLVVVRATGEDEEQALDLLERFSDQEVGFVDCLSFALMRRHRIHEAFSFDRHFTLSGATLIE